ncbi:hypothetical protein GGS20DRAFT_277789 [Poronia punctata]|nr:hypothetical protein GGS20DRAFT_277789 [Poronia punctata]
MSSSIPTQLAEIIQTSHIQRSPSPGHDLNPSTAASTRVPAYVTRSRTRNKLLLEDHDEIPVSVLERPRRRRAQSFPPMPDLRFEQSYLHSIAGAETWWRVAWITVRDQVMMPLAQGVLYNLAIVGWQHWNRSAQISGNSAGARLRRWWYEVNNWPLPPKAKARR